MRDCLDEATLQAYLDGELPSESAAAVAAHLGACGGCDAAAREAAREFAMFATAFGAGDGLRVPTERLRAGISARIAEMQPQPIAQPIAAAPTFVERLRGFASSLASAPRQATAFASFAVAAVLLGALFYAFRPQTRTPQINQGGASEIEAVKPTANGQGGATAKGAGSGEAVNTETANDVAEIGAGAGETARGDETEARRNRNRTATSVPVNFNPRRAAGGEAVGLAKAKDEKAADAALLPVEKSYVTAIASLKSSIDGAQTMTPTLRAEYERNLAVVDRAIAASRASARRAPADKDAQDFLRSAYQDKLDLLHAVADQTQLASITR
ncbi:MAG: zf-HC2 domain-containing protein [Pyrinomonadaceae bacterium]